MFNCELKFLEKAFRSSIDVCCIPHYFYVLREKLLSGSYM